MKLSTYLSRKGESGRDFAKRSGLTQTTVSRILLGRWGRKLTLTVELAQAVTKATRGAVDLTQGRDRDLPAPVGKPRRPKPAPAPEVAPAAGPANFHPEWQEETT